MSAIVLDLDGTLLNSNKEVSKRSLEVLLECNQIGIKIIIATARPPRSVRSMLPIELLAISSFVFYNGALIVDTHMGWEEHLPMDISSVADVLDFCSSNLPDCTVSLEVKDEWFANREILDFVGFNPLFRPIVCTYGELKQYVATKILITDFGDPEELRHTFENKVHFVITDQGDLIQIMNKSVSKATGILKLVSNYGIDISEVMVFGDDYNDLEMFKMSAYSVAMMNAVEELKELANEITDSNDSDGVAKVLEKMLR